MMLMNEENKKPVISYNNLKSLWLNENFRIGILLICIFILALFLRTYFVVGPSTAGFDVSGGSDTFYYKRTIDYAQTNHRQLTWDPLLNYPSGSINPRPPFYTWTTVVLGDVLTPVTSPLLGWDEYTTTFYMFMLMPALFGALTVIPLYYLGRDMFGKKAGLIAAFFLAITPGHLERSTFAFSDHDSFLLFFTVCGFFFYLRSLEKLGDEYWVRDWKSPTSIFTGLKYFLKRNKIAIGYAAMAGMSFGAVSLGWQGFTYVFAIIFIYYVVQILTNHARRVDSLGIAVCTAISLAIPLFISIPPYNATGLALTEWGLLPGFIILLAVICAAFILVPTRDFPLILVIGVTAFITAMALLILTFVIPSIGNMLFTGAGYFIKNKLYSTIAEAQPGDFSRLVFSYGPITFYLALIAIVFAVLRTYKTWKSADVFATVWAIVSIYMALSAVRFMFNASPVFAVLAGYGLWEIMRRLDFHTVWKNIKAAKGERLHTFRREVKSLHILGVLFVAFLVLYPNLWYAFDASIPFEKKKEYDQKIYDITPAFLRPEGYEGGGLWYLGSFGPSFSSEYWIDGYKWLSEQDNDVPAEMRPAFVSWWDYGFEAAQSGKHPTAADNFQAGYQFAGNVITSQNESMTVSMFIIRLLEGGSAWENNVSSGRFSKEIRDVLVNRLGNERTNKLEKIMTGTSEIVDMVNNDPGKYEIFNPDTNEYSGHSDLTYFNARYLVGRALLEELNDESLVSLYHDVRDVMGKSIRYFAIDSRLFPFSATNTGIFYAPVKLADYRIIDGQPIDFIETKVETESGTIMTIEDASEMAQKDSTFRIKDYVLEYKRSFYNSMLYRTYIGYSGYDLGMGDQGVPAIAPKGEFANNDQFYPMQGWMMKHFKLAYKTAYWNPYNRSVVEQYQNAWVLMSYDKAIENQKTFGGTITTSLYSAVMFLKYYDGAFINGSIKTEGGMPIPNVRVTVFDEYETPHDTVLTNESGFYSILAPYGNTTLRVSSGGSLDQLFQIEKTVLNTTNIIISDAQAMRENIDNDRDGTYDYNIRNDITLKSIKLTVETRIDNAVTDKTAIITLESPSPVQTKSVNTVNGVAVFSDVAPSTYDITAKFGNHTSMPFEATFTPTDADAPQTRTINVNGSVIGGFVKLSDGTTKDSIRLSLYDEDDKTKKETTSGSDGAYTFSGLLPGNYTLSVKEPGFLPFTKLYTFTGTAITEDGEETDREIRLDENVSLIQRIVVNGSISGITQDGIAVPLTNAMMRFDNMDGGISVTSISNESGAYTVELPNGNFTVYSKYDYAYWKLESKTSDTFVHLSRLNTGDLEKTDFYYNITASNSKHISKVDGTVYADLNDNGINEASEIVTDTCVTFTSMDNASLNLPTNANGSYRTYIPQGRYFVNATYYDYAAMNDSVYAYADIININEKAMELPPIVLRKAAKVSGMLYWDHNNDSEYNIGEELSDTTILFWNNKCSIKTMSSDNGSYQIFLPRGNEYNITGVYYNVMDRTDIVSDNDKVADISLEPKNITVTTRVYYDSNNNGVFDNNEVPIDNILLNFEGIGAYTKSVYNITTVSGKCNVSLIPGKYRIINSTNIENKTYYSYSIDVNIDIGNKPIAIEVSAEKLVYVNVSAFVENTGEYVSAQVEFAVKGNRGENKTFVATNGSYSGYIRAGEYNVWSEYVNQTDNKHYVSLFKTVINNEPSIAITLVEGMRILASATYINAIGLATNVGETDIPVKFTKIDDKAIRTISLGNLGAGSVYLPPTEYMLNIDYSKDEGSGPTVNAKYSYYKPEENIPSPSISVTSYNLSIPLNKTVRAYGTTFFDKNNNGMSDSGEEQSNVRVTFFGNKGGTYECTTDTSGQYNFYAPFDVYRVKVEKIGFEEEPVVGSVAITPGNVMNNISIVQIEPLLNGIAYYDDARDGIYNGTEQKVYMTKLEFVGERNTSAPLDTITSDGYHGIKLSPGKYTVYAVGYDTAQNIYSIIDSVEIPTSNNRTYHHDLPFYRGMSITGKVSYCNTTGATIDMPSGEIAFKKGDTSLKIAVARGTYDTVLPMGEYAASVSHTSREFNIDMPYNVEKKLNVTEQQTAYNLELSKEKKYTFELTASNPAQTTSQGASIQYNIIVENTGNENNNISLECAYVGWEISIDNSALELKIGESKNTTIRVHTSSDATSTDPHQIQVTGKSRINTGVTDTLSLTTNIKQVYGVEITTLNPKQSILPNTSATYTFTITNDGNGLDTFSLFNSTLPDGWTVNFNRTSIDIGPKGSGEISATVENTVGAGNSTVLTIYAFSKDNVTSAQVNITTNAKTASVTARASDITFQNADLREGGQITINATVLNSEVPLKDTIIEFYIAGRYIGNETLFRLDENEIRNVSVTLNVSSGEWNKTILRESEYPVTLRIADLQNNTIAMSDGAKMLFVGVKVEQVFNWKPIIFVVGIVVATLLVLMILRVIAKRKGRI
ncbi:MAG: carboxypeptidase regulatory-like domain-containing protein [Thermoplasmata archaeon]